jgi:hypothetical protein
MWFKKMLSGIVACSLFVTLAGATYATPVGVKETYSADGRSLTIDKETVTTYVTVHEISETVDIEVVDKQTGQTLFKEEGASVPEVLSWLEKPTEGKRKKRAVPIAIPFVVAGVEKLVVLAGFGTALYAKHKMEERSGPIGKPNLKGQGRETIQKKRQDKKWKNNSNKNPNRPMKKHTPSPKHKGGKKKK